MARMSELMLDVEEMIRAGSTADDIVEELGIPFQWVLDIGNSMDLGTGWFVETIKAAKEAV